MRLRDRLFEAHSPGRVNGPRAVEPVRRPATVEAPRGLKGTEMALEISEIGIHVRVPDGKPAPAGSAPGAEPGGGPCDEVEHARVVDDCVRRVLRILAARAER